MLFAYYCWRRHKRWSLEIAWSCTSSLEKGEISHITQWFCDQRERQRRRRLQVTVVAGVYCAGLITVGEKSSSDVISERVSSVMSVQLQLNCICRIAIAGKSGSKTQVLAPGRHGSASDISRNASAGDISDPYKVQFQQRQRMRDFNFGKGVVWVHFSTLSPIFTVRLRSIRTVLLSTFCPSSVPLSVCLSNAWIVTKRDDCL